MKTLKDKISHSAPDGLLLEMEKRNLMLLIKNWILAQGR